MIEPECLICGKIIKVPQYIDTERYDGQVTCQECGSLFHIKLVRSKVQGYKVVEKKLIKLTADEYFQLKEEADKELKEFHDRIKGEGVE